MIEDGAGTARDAGPALFYAMAAALSGRRGARIVTGAALSFSHASASSTALGKTARPFTWRIGNSQLSRDRYETGNRCWLMTLAPVRRSKFCGRLASSSAK